MPNQSRQVLLDRLSHDYAKLRAELAEVGYLLQGSVTERRIPCGKKSCACTADVDAWHGPYIQWSLRKRGRTVSTYLSPEQAALCREWIDNSRKLEKIIIRMRKLSLRIARLYKIPKL
jgi:hypothetical protein